MDRRRFLLTSVAGALAAPLAAEAQQAGRVWRIGILWTTSQPPDPIPADSIIRPLIDALLEGLRDVGYAQGRNLVIEHRWANLDPARLPALAAELARLKVDVIVTTGDGEVRAARQATSTIPIVMAVSGDPVGAGYVTSLARPGGNVTGLSYVSPDVNPKLLEALKETMPALARLAILWNAANPVKQLDFRETAEAARRLGLKVDSVTVRGMSDFEAAFQAITRARAQAVLTLVDEVMNQGTYRRAIAGFAAQSRLPAVAADRRHVADGALISYGPSLVGMFRRTAVYVDKILKGSEPAQLPVEQPTHFELAINLKTARTLGLTIPPSLLLRADQIIE